MIPSSAHSLHCNMRQRWASTRACASMMQHVLSHCTGCYEVIGIVLLKDAITILAISYCLIVSHDLHCASVVSVERGSTCFESMRNTSSKVKSLTPFFPQSTCPAPFHLRHRSARHQNLWFCATSSEHGPRCRRIRTCGPLRHLIRIFGFGISFCELSKVRSHLAVDVVDERDALLALLLLLVPGKWPAPRVDADLAFHVFDLVVVFLPQTLLFLVQDLELRVQRFELLHVFLSRANTARQSWARNASVDDGRWKEEHPQCTEMLRCSGGGFWMRGAGSWVWNVGHERTPRDPTTHPTRLLHMPRDHFI